MNGGHASLCPPYASCISAAIFASPPEGITAAAAAASLREARILVRRFTLPGLEGALRITVGDRTATDRVLAVITALNGKTLSGT